MHTRQSLVLLILLGTLTIAGLGCGTFSSRRKPSEAKDLVVDRQPVNFVNRVFDPANPPADMPPLTEGEEAECDSDFGSNASVGGETRQIDATHSNLTITKIKMTLQLNITIWVPAGTTQHVIDHEEGHRQISESYYRTADMPARQIAARYMGKQIEIANSNQASDDALHRVAAEIAAEYNREIDPNPTQLLYDQITDHARNDVDAHDAVTHALKNVTIESPQPTN